MKKVYFPDIFRNSLVMGTFILTVTGFVSRIIGFFNRIFISHAFGEEAMGIFQLVAPVLAFTFSLCCAGIQTAISKYVASEPHTHDYRTSMKYLRVSIIVSLSLSCLTGIFVYRFSDMIATGFLFEPRTAPLLRILAVSFPFSAIHSCINGYYYGIKNAKVPALLQLCEQIVRVGSVYFLYYLLLERNYQPDITLAAVGIAAGELCSLLLSLTFIFTRFYRFETTGTKIDSVMLGKNSYRNVFRHIMVMAVPLSANRIIVNLLQSVEAIYIPEKLRQFGMSTSGALSTYGVLTGMALSLILFPCAITNSLGVLLLPVVSEAEAANQNGKIAAAIKKSITYCSLLGIVCTMFFLFFGKTAGILLFKSELAGSFICGLSFICPFLYITSTLGSILHGLGRAFTTFLINIGALFIRILSVFFLVPKIGINGYIAGLLLSQVFSALVCTLCLNKYRQY